MSSFDLDRYLERTGISQLPATAEERLREIHTRQALTVPFENFDIHMGRPISVIQSDVEKKIVENRRGGYCYELNTLLIAALRSAGLEVQPRMARVLFGRTGPSARSHLVLEVTASGRMWLADVGFGGPGLFEPMPLEPGYESVQAGSRYRLRRDSYGMLLERSAGETWMPIYVFADEPCLPEDIEMSNHFTSTFPGSPFRRMRMCAIHRPWGKATLMDYNVTLTRHDGTSESIRLKPGPEYLSALETHFGLNLGVSYDSLTGPA